jgi:hypothetical protein
VGSGTTIALTRQTLPGEVRDGTRTVDDLFLGGHLLADLVEKVGARIGCNSNEAVFAEVRTA